MVDSLFEMIFVSLPRNKEKLYHDEHVGGENDKPLGLSFNLIGLRPGIEGLFESASLLGLKRRK